MIPDSFSTPRLAAERMRASHFDELRVMHQNEAMMAMIGGVRDADSTTAYLARHMTHWDESGYGFWVLRDIATGTSAGIGGLRRLRLDDVDELEIGYGFLPPFWGRGLGTEVADRFVAMAFDRLESPSVVALTAEANRASQRVLQKVGLRFDRLVTIEERTSMLFRGRNIGAPP